MLGSVDRRSFGAAAAENINIRVLAAGRDKSHAIAAQRLEDRANKHQIRYSHAMSQDEGGEIIAALPSTGRYGYTVACNEQESTIAATRIATDITATAGRDGPPVYQNLVSFAAAVSGRGVGLCGP